MAPIGFSTGCMFRSKLPMDRVISLYAKAGMDGIEILFDTPEEMFSFEPKEKRLKS